jgi:predicted nucleotide-binding protein (sugar kinase/HSP70/actin superfamily)
MCPKVLGLTDMVRNVFPRLPELLDPRINAKLPRPLGFAEAFSWVGRRLTNSEQCISRAWNAAREAQTKYQQRLLCHPLDEALKPWDGALHQKWDGVWNEPLMRVAVIGRAYVVFDAVLSHNLIGTLRRRQVEVVTAEHLPQDVKEEQDNSLPKKVYWQLGKDLVGAALHYAEAPGIDGIINISIFGCGQDSFTTALIERYVRERSSIPFLDLVLDDHFADSGLITRIEAFLDMIEQRRKILGMKLQSSAAWTAKTTRKRAEKPSHVPGEMHLTIPHMGHLHLGFENVFKRLGVHIYMPPRPNKEALMLGARYAPSGACLPFKLNLGNMVQALNHGVTDIMMAGGCGPCRFGYYSVLQEQILRTLGYQFRMGSADNPDSLHDQLATVKKIAGLKSKWASYKVFLFIIYRLALVDVALRQASRLRPREQEKHAADRTLKNCLRVIDATQRFRDLLPAWRAVHRLFNAVPRDRSRQVVRVGLVGEIFMVLENHANKNVEERLGEMGVEVHRGVWLSDWLNDRFHFIPFRRNQFQWALRQAAPYLYDPCGGESVKSVGKSLHFARQGFDGIVHLMPLACMPELVAQTILARVSTDYNIPVLTLAFDEHSSPGAVQTRLEAFVDLIKRRR